MSHDSLHGPLQDLRPHTPEWDDTADHLGTVLLCAALDLDEQLGSQTAAELRQLRGPWDARVMCGWVDVARRHVDPDGVSPATVSLHFAAVGPDSVSTVDVDDTPPDARWAGRFVAARLAHDNDTCHALLTDPATAATRGARLCVVLQIVVGILAGHTRPGPPAAGGAR